MIGTVVDTEGQHMAAWKLIDSEEIDIRPQVMRAVHDLIGAVSDRGPAALTGGRQAELRQLACDARDALAMLDPRGPIGGFRYPGVDPQDRRRLSNLTDAAAAIAGRIADGGAQPADVGELKRLADAIVAWPNLPAPEQSASTGATPASANKGATKGKVAGRPRGGSKAKDPEGDEKLMQAWETAHQTRGLTKKEFAGERNMPFVAVKHAIDRARQARKRWK